MNQTDDPTQRSRMDNLRLLPRRAVARAEARRRPKIKKDIYLQKGVYLLPSLFTTGNLFCGLFSMISTFNGHYFQAAIFIMLAHLCDGLDGAVARFTKTTSQFGIEFDSLADVVSFGVAPAILVYYWALVPWKTWGWLAASLYVVCGALRLARFNVQNRTVEKTSFVGLPIPAAAEMIASTVLMYYFLGGEGAANKRVILLLVIYLLAGLMVSNFQYFSQKQLNLKKRHPFWILVSGILFIKLTIAEPQIMFFTVFLLYTLSGPFLWCVAAYKRRRERLEEVLPAVQ